VCLPASCDDSSTTCEVVSGLAVCQCLSGLVRKEDDATACVDFDECVELAPCGADMTCVNNVGSFSCNCGGGSVSTGIDSCTPIDSADVVDGEGYSLVWNVSCQTATSAAVATFRDRVAVELSINPSRAQVSTVVCHSDMSAISVAMVFLPPAKSESASVPSLADVKSTLEGDDAFGSSFEVTGVVALGPVEKVTVDASPGSLYEDGVRDESLSDVVETVESATSAGTPIVIGAVVAALLVVGVLAVLVTRRRRRGDGEDPDSRHGARLTATSMSSMSSIRAPDDYAAPPSRKQISSATLGGNTMSDAYDVPSSSGRPTKGSNTAFSSLGVSVDFLIDGDEITRSAKIGEGAFGLVLKGSWGDKAVAIKEVKGTDKEALRQLLDEGQKLVNIPPHDNLVTFYGVCDDPPAIILQFCDDGSLLDRLYGPRANDKPALTHDELVAIATGVARGLHHLHRERVIHRDVAARNVLLHDGIAKVTDMGMARDNAGEGAGANYFQQTKTTTGPLKWMAHEQLTARAVSYKADVYSYGIVLVEMWGKAEPWDGMTAIEAAAMVIGGQCHAIPPRTPLLIAATMSACLQKDPHARPSMQRIVSVLSEEEVDAKQLVDVSDSTNTATHPDVLAARAKFYSKETNNVDLPESAANYRAPAKAGNAGVVSQSYTEPPSEVGADEAAYKEPPPATELPASASSRRRRKKPKDETTKDP